MENDELKSVVPSRMKRKQDIDITKKQPLKARVRTVVFTNQNESSDHAIEEHKEIVSMNHVTAEEVTNPDEEIETDEAPKTLEDGGQATVDELKELNLGTREDPRPIYISALLTQAEEQDQLLGEYEVKKEDLIPYHKHSSRLLDKFDIVKLSHVPRSANKMADALASLATTLALGAEEIMSVSVCNCWVVASEEYEVEDDEVEEVDMITVCQIDKEDWRQQIIDYLEHQKLPNDPRHRKEIHCRASRFILFKGTLYRRSFDKLWSRCLEDEEAAKIIEEFHSRICGAHQSGPKLHDLGDMVLAVRRPIITSRKIGNKFTSKWDGPYVVREVYTNGAYKIVDAEGLRVGPINGMFLKRYYS
uniref:RNase H type-1 domain-containing protein n=1 Tax=Chenopodium quinoa TaxID=63459 RepID=A0A803MBC6_CHEQI